VSERNSQDELSTEQQEARSGSGDDANSPPADDLSLSEDVTAAEDAPPEDVPAAGDAASRDSVAVEESPAAEEPATESATESGTASQTGEAGPNGRQIGVPGMDWYIIHTYSGFENKVKESLRSRAEAFGCGERVGEILIPTEDVVEMRSGKKVTSKRMLYPGYVLVQLHMDDEMWHVVKNTPRVTGFVGGGQAPTPLTADEVNQTLYRQKTSAEKPRPKMSFERNDRVKIIDGPFANFAGSVEEVNEDRNTVKVMVTIFGRGTPVELEYFQVEKEGD
jgi:transcriptional antiterminator NusG